MKKLPSKQINGKEELVDFSEMDKKERAKYFASMAIENLSKASLIKESKDK